MKFNFKTLQLNGVFMENRIRKVLLDHCVKYPILLKKFDEIKIPNYKLKKLLNKIERRIGIERTADNIPRNYSDVDDDYTNNACSFKIINRPKITVEIKRHSKSILSRKPVLKPLQINCIKKELKTKVYKGTPLQIQYNRSRLSRMPRIKHCLKSCLQINKFDNLRSYHKE